MAERGAVSVVLAVFIATGFALPAEAAGAATFTVNAIDNTDDGSCDAVHCSLREAINAANANPSPAPDQDRIEFDLPGPAPHTISVGQSLGEHLPVVTDPVIIDGTTQAGYAGSPIVEISGSGTPFEIFWISGGHSTVRGLVLNRAATAIRLVGIGDNLIERNFIGTDVAGAAGLRGGIHGPDSPNTRILHNLIAGGPASDTIVMSSPGTILQANYIGTNATGTAAVGGGGVALCCDGNVVGGNRLLGEGNLISGLSGGISVGGASGVDEGPSDNRVQGNLVGTDASGTQLLANSGNGITVYGDRNIIGGSEAGEGNVVAGNIGDGVALFGNNNMVSGNRLGTDISGTKVDFGNVYGLAIEGDDNIVGGTDGSTPAGPCTGACNLISGNRGYGLVATGARTTVRGNFIGTDISGSKDVGNTASGVLINGEGDLVGGPGAAGNLISGNDATGAVIFSTDSRVEGNQIGTDVTGSLALPNSGDGLWLAGTDNVAGGVLPSSRNVISGNRGFGVELDGPRDALQMNYIGLDVSGDHAVPNMAGGVNVGGSDGIVVGAPGARNVISGNGGPGLSIHCCRQGITIQANFIGTDETGMHRRANAEDGIRFGNDDDVLVGGPPGAGNVISANGGDGVEIGPGGSRVSVLGNLIGTDATGAAGLGNGGAGVRAAGATIGAVVDGGRNIISANDGDGVVINGLVSVKGNFIGTDIGGTAALGNAGNGVSAPGGGGNQIGGRAHGEGNVISGNQLNGVLSGTDSAIEGNFIGSDVSGIVGLGNGLAGVRSTGLNARIGGSADGAGNVISGNRGPGVEVVAAFNSVEGNHIGTDLNATLDLGNAGHGVVVDLGGANRVGGLDLGAENVIRFNGGDGVAITGNVGNAILRNSISSNTGLGIDLDDDGVTLNDPGDPDASANFGQNFPVVTGITGGGTAVQGTLDSQSNTAYRIELFGNPECDPSGYGEGAKFLAATTVTTDGTGHATFVVSLADPVPAGSVVTATATDPGNNTSEFSACSDHVTEAPGRIVIRKVTNPSGGSQNFTFDPSYGVAFSLMDGQSNDSGPLAPGSYTVSESAKTGWDLTELSCSDGSDTSLAAGTATIHVEAGETVTCRFTNTERGSITIVKNTIGGDGWFAYTSANLGSFSLTTSGGTTSRSFDDLASGSYAVTETDPAPTFDFTSLACIDSDGGTTTAGRKATIDLDPGQRITCTYTNTKRGSITVTKTVNGVVNPGIDLQFALSRSGVGLETLSTMGDADGVLVFVTKLVPGTTYTMCEQNVPAGFSSRWKLEGVLVTPYNPNAVDSPPQDLGNRCYDFTVQPGQTRSFDVDNSRPGGEPRTIGYWKNWNRCTGGGQAKNADRNGGKATGFYLVEDLLPQLIGDFNVTTCQQAVKILSKQDQAGKSKSSDAAYELAAQLLAARFDLGAGAETCSAVQTNLVDGQALLDLINFTGSGDYLGSKVKGALLTLRKQALVIATNLDSYNNGNLC
jgi:CSLREA domain-containing protein